MKKKQNPNRLLFDFDDAFLFYITNTHGRGCFYRNIFHSEYIMSIILYTGYIKYTNKICGLD